MRTTIILMMTLSITLSLLPIILAQTETVMSPPKYAGNEGLQQQLKEEVKLQLEEKKERLLTEAQKNIKEKEELENLGGIRETEIHLTNEEKTTTLILKEKIEGEKINRTLHYQQEGKEEEIHVTLRIRIYQTENNTERIRAELLDGKEKDIKILPEQALNIAKEKLGTNTKLKELTEKEYENKQRIIYKTTTTNKKKLLGIITINIETTAELDAETGELLQEHKPWWNIITTKE